MHMNGINLYLLLKPFIQNGRLLSDLVQHFTGGAQYQYCNRQESRHEILSRIEHTLHCLREVPAMPQQYLWCEEKV